MLYFTNELYILLGNIGHLHSINFLSWNCFNVFSKTSSTANLLVVAPLGLTTNINSQPTDIIKNKKGK